MVYGIPQGNKINETQKLNPIGEYGKSKLKAENELKKAIMISNLFMKRCYSFLIFNNGFHFVPRWYGFTTFPNPSSCSFHIVKIDY